MPELQEIIQMEHAKESSEVLLFHEGLFLKAYEGSAQQLAARYGFKVSVRHVKAVNQQVASVGFPFSSLGTYAPQAEERGGHWLLLLPPVAAMPLDDWKRSIAGDSRPEQWDADVAAAVRRFPLESSTPLECMQFLARWKKKLLLGIVFFVIGSAWGRPTQVVVDTLIQGPRPSNYLPLPSSLTPDELWERLVARPMRLGEGGWLQGFAFDCCRTTVMADGSRVSHPLLRVVADHEGVYALAPCLALRATADSAWLASGLYGSLLCCSAARTPGSPDCYRQLLDECFHGIDRCCPTLFTPFAEGQPATMSVEFTVCDTVRCILFSQLAPSSQGVWRDGRPSADTLRVCYNHGMGVVTWIERIPAADSLPRERYELRNWHLSPLPYKPEFIARKLDRAAAEAAGWRCYVLPGEMPLWLSRRSSANRVLTRAAAMHPLTGVDGDTVRLAADTGWRLVVMWDYGCAGCEQLLRQLQLPARPGSLLTRMEAAGITLYAVNPFGGRTEAFEDYARRSRQPGRLFAAPDMAELSSRELPAAYLYRPDGRLACALSGSSCSPDIIIHAKQRCCEKQE